MLEENLSEPIPGPGRDGLIKAGALRAFLGDVCRETLEKWLDLPDFPQPILIGRDRYWFLHEVWAWALRQPRWKRKE